MIKLALAAATTAVIFCSGLSYQAKAEDLGNGYHPNAYVQPQGEAGSRWGNQCWVETWGAGSSYFGYWKACPTPSRQGPRNADRDRSRSSHNLVGSKPGVNRVRYSE